MERLKKRFLMFVIPVALILFAALLVAQLVAQGPPPNQCLNCAVAYKNAVSDCHGDQACLAKARAAALQCLQGCGLPPR